MKKTAVVLFNLGGPDVQESVQPFLYNLFSDPAIIGAPQPIRYLIAKLISTRRAPIARQIYAHLGGGSPILKNTQAQAQALEAELNSNAQDEEYKTFIAMRYWHPFTEEAAQAVKNYAPDEIILLPLYPQFSTTTVGSSVKAWHKTAKKLGIKAPTQAICCYPHNEGFINALTSAIHPAYQEASKFGKPRILFSAHGLPEKIVKAGDPYQIQCGLTVEAMRQKLAIENLDFVLCFQSRVGPLKWIGPSTDAEILRAGQDKTPLIVVPIAFVSDHSETLVEIDIEYRHLAKEKGVPHFGYVPTVGTHSDFIRGLAAITRANQKMKKSYACATGAKLCSSEFSGCPCKTN